MKIFQIIRKRRAVSPILAAILLIGLAVAAGAVLFVVVLPMIAGTADVKVVSAVAADRNNDGLLDQITVQVQNKGAATDTFSDGTISLSGWSTAGNIEVTSANPVDIVFKTTDVSSQIKESDEVAITLSFDTSADISISESDIDMDKATTLTESDMLIDFTSTSGTVAQSDTTSGLQKWWGNDANAGADATHSGNAGLRIRSDNGNPACYFSWTKSTVADGTAYGTMNNYDNQQTTWDKSTKPILSFWVKSDRVFVNTNFRIYLTAYDGQTEQGDFYYDIDTNILTTAAGYTANTWAHVVLDTPDWTGYDSDEVAAATAGCVTFYVDNDMGANDWDIYLDDFSVHSGLS